MKRVLYLLLLVVVALAGGLVLRALVGPAAQPASAARAPFSVADEPATLERFAATIRIATLSHQDPAEDDPAPFQGRGDRPLDVQERIDRRLRVEVGDRFKDLFAAAHAGQPVVDERDAQTAVRGWRPEVRGPNPEVRGPRREVRREWGSDPGICVVVRTSNFGSRSSAETAHPVITSL